MNEEVSKKLELIRQTLRETEVQGVRLRGCIIKNYEFSTSIR